MRLTYPLIGAGIGYLLALLAWTGWVPTFDQHPLVLVFIFPVVGLVVGIVVAIAGAAKDASS